MSGGTPPGWRFVFPDDGDPASGRQVFIAMKCYSCHEVKGEAFPQSPKDNADVGPELTGMGALHPAEYFAEAILSPNSVIIEGPGYTGPDRLSKMPDYRDSLSVAQLIDLVAYLKSLTAGGHQPASSSSTPTPKKEAPTGGHRMH